MSLSNRWGLTMILGGGLFIAAVYPLAADNLYAGADFSLSSDPSAVLLFVQVGTPTTGITRSMRLFGDGRLELATSRASVPERHSISLDDEAKRALVAIAVNHGLAEWDTTRIESEKAIALDGRQFVASDGNVVRVMLTLERYQRGDQVRENVTKSMTVSSPNLAVRYFPNVPEFKGVSDLELYLRRTLDAEGMDR